MGSKINSFSVHWSRGLTTTERLQRVTASRSSEQAAAGYNTSVLFTILRLQGERGERKRLQGRGESDERGWNIQGGETKAISKL